MKKEYIKLSKYLILIRVRYMKIVSWNCGGGFYTYNKYKKIRELDADIYVIQEVNNPKNTDEEYKEFMKNSRLLPYFDTDTGWDKGIAVIAKEHINLDELHWDYEYNDFLSLRVNDSFNLVAVWTHDKVKVDGEWKEHGKGISEYVKRAAEYVCLYEHELRTSDNLVMCGDFNIEITNNNHKNKGKFAYILKDYGYESIYHKLNNKELNEKCEPTLYMGRKSGADNEFYVDYLFTKPELVTSFEIGNKDEYIGPAKTDKSDHVPLIFEVDL